MFASFCRFENNPIFVPVFFENQENCITAKKNNRGVRKQ
jgi:hypothetical protein